MADATAAFLGNLFNHSAGGADSQDISQFQRDVAANDLWSTAATPIMNAQFNTRSWTPMQSGITTALQAFTGTLLRDIGQRDQAAQLSAVAPVLNQLYSDPLSVGVPEGVDETAFGRLQLNTITRKAQQDAQMKEVAKYEVMKDLFSKRPDLAAQALKIPDSQGPSLADELLEAPIKRLTDEGPEFGVESLEEMHDRLRRKSMLLGIPAATAEVSARETVDAVRKQGRALLGDKLAKQAETIAQTEDLVRKGQEGIATAGETGFPGASTYEWLTSYLPWADEAKTQSAGDAKLAETRQLTAAVNKVVGSGGLNEAEAKALFSAAMSPDQNKSQNEAILRGYENGLKIMKEHQDFMNYFTNKTGGNPETAQTMWELYKKSNPILKQNNKGQFVPNENRSPWQKFDFVNAYKNHVTGGDAPVSAGKNNGGPIPTNETVKSGPHKGKKVYIVNGVKGVID